jgi:hypothetical protein
MEYTGAIVAEEWFLSRTTLVATVTEEASLHEVTFFDDLLVQTTPPFIDQEALTDLDSYLLFELQLYR